MKTLKLLSILVFALCLVGTVSAFGAVYGEWEDESQTIVITEGESIDFLYDFFSMDIPMTANIKLYDSQFNLVYVFEDDNVLSSPSCTQSGEPISGTVCYGGIYTVDQSVYTSAGSYELILTYSDTEPYSNSHTLYLTINQIQDTNIPVITLLGDNPINVVQGTTYTDAGATAYDQEDGDITSEIVVVNPVDTNTVGVYTITYNVQDEAENSAVQVTRTVNVIKATSDTTAPVITITIPQAATYSAAEMTFEISTDESATAEYSLDGASNIAMTETSTNVFESEILALSDGEHTVVFYATDTAGNMATSETITFTIDLSSTAPTITVIIPEQDKEYDESKLTFRVEVDEIAKVVFWLDNDFQVTMDYVGISNGILTFEYEVELDDGDHTVTFTATDASRNTASVTIEFSVDTSTSDKDDDKKYTNYYQSNYEEELYLDQFKNSKIIYLEDDEPEDKMTWFQKLIAWLKKIFGFN